MICRICSTESQNYVHEEEEDEYVAPTGTRRRVIAVKKKSTAEDLMISDGIQDLLSINILDIGQLLIIRMAQRLSDLLLQPQLLPTVEWVWFRFITVLLKEKAPTMVENRSFPSHRPLPAFVNPLDSRQLLQSSFLELESSRVIEDRKTSELSSRPAKSETPSKRQKVSGGGSGSGSGGSDLEFALAPPSFSSSDHLSSHSSDPSLRGNHPPPRRETDQLRSMLGTLVSSTAAESASTALDDLHPSLDTSEDGDKSREGEFNEFKVPSLQEAIENRNLKKRKQRKASQSLADTNNYVGAPEYVFDSPLKKRRDISSFAASSLKKDLFPPATTAKPPKNPNPSGRIKLTLMNIVDLLYLACLRLREPIFPHEFVKLVEGDKLDLNAAIKEIPSCALVFNSFLKMYLCDVDYLPTRISLLSYRIGISFPLPNGPLMIRKMVSILHLPRQIESWANKLNALSTLQNKNYRTTRNLKTPFCDMAASIMVCLKMIYGLPSDPLNPLPRRYTSKNLHQLTRNFAADSLVEERLSGFPSLKTLVKDVQNVRQFDDSSLRFFAEASFQSIVDFAHKHQVLPTSISPRYANDVGMLLSTVETSLNNPSSVITPSEFSSSRSCSPITPPSSPLPSSSGFSRFGDDQPPYYHYIRCKEDIFDGYYKTLLESITSIFSGLEMTPASIHMQVLQLENFLFDLPQQEVS